MEERERWKKNTAPSQDQFPGATCSPSRLGAHIVNQPPICQENDRERISDKERTRETEGLEKRGRAREREREEEEQRKRTRNETMLVGALRQATLLLVTLLVSLGYLLFSSLKVRAHGARPDNRAAI